MDWIDDTRHWEKIKETPDTTENIEEIKGLIRVGCGIDGGHHTKWALDQIARILLGSQYEQFVKDCVYCDGEIYDYDIGIAP